MTGDVFRTACGDPNQLPNVRWLRGEVSRVLYELTGLWPDVRYRRNAPDDGHAVIADWYGLLGHAPSVEAWAATYGQVDPPPDLVDALRPDYDRALVIGFELSPLMRSILDRIGAPWVDVEVSPLRFLDDLALSLRCSWPIEGPVDRIAHPGLVSPNHVAEAVARLRAQPGRPGGSRLQRRAHLPGPDPARPLADQGRRLLSRRRGGGAGGAGTGRAAARPQATPAGSGQPPARHAPAALRGATHRGQHLRPAGHGQRRAAHHHLIVGGHRGAPLRPPSEDVPPGGARRPRALHQPVGAQVRRVLARRARADPAAQSRRRVRGAHDPRPPAPQPRRLGLRTGRRGQTARSGEGRG